MSRAKNAKKEPLAKSLPRPRIDPVTYARRIQGGNARANAALGHLLEARRHLNAACADLCSVVGANDFWRALSRLSNATDIEKQHLDEAIHDDADPLYLDHEPTENELIAPHRYGCFDVDPVAEAERVKPVSEIPAERRSDAVQPGQGAKPK